MLGPRLPPAGGAVMPAASFVSAAGMSYIDQCSSGPPRKFTSASCMITTKELVPEGPFDQARPGKTLPRYWVFSSGMSPPSLNAGDDTLSVLPPLAGKVVSASPGLAAAGGGAAWASAAIGASSAATAIAARIRVALRIELPPSVV